MTNTVHLCPKCGSTNTKFPDPLRGTESMINLPEFINNLYQCADCEYVGIFFSVDKDKVEKVQKEFKTKK